MRIAVTGARGRIGRKVVDLLVADREHQVVAMTRSSDNPLGSPGVEWGVADYEDLPALCKVMQDVDTLVFISSDGEGWKVLQHHRNVIEAAAASGVGHIVALSGLDADARSPFCYAVTYAYTEQLISDCGCSFSVARASIYTEFFLQWLIQGRDTGQLRLPASDGRISLVSRGDVAQSLAALATAAPTGNRHEITGPEALDLHALAGMAEREWGKRIEYVNTTPTDHRIAMALAGEEAWWQYAYSTMFESIRDQRWEKVTDQVLSLTGHNPTSVAGVIRRH
jgi:NAD(P)H dehydrogenase (quinone)